jgi:hypothetical protein
VYATRTTTGALCFFVGSSMVPQLSPNLANRARLSQLYPMNFTRDANKHLETPTAGTVPVF